MPRRTLEGEKLAVPKETSYSTKIIQFWGLLTKSVLLASIKMIEIDIFLFIDAKADFLKFLLLFVFVSGTLRNHVKRRENQTLLQLLLENHKVAL